MKYKLIDSVSKIETLCEKVTIDGFDYYLSDEKPKIGDIVIEKYVDGTIGLEQIDTLNDIHPLVHKKVIATTNSNIDIPKVFDEVEELAKQLIHSEGIEVEIVRTVWINGYNKSQETHPFSDEDMIEFADWISKEFNISNGIGWWHSHESIEDISTKELLQLWKEQQPKIVYYG